MFVTEKESLFFVQPRFGNVVTLSKWHKTGGHEGSGDWQGLVCRTNFWKPEISNSSKKKKGIPLELKGVIIFLEYPQLTMCWKKKSPHFPLNIAAFLFCPSSTA